MVQYLILADVLDRDLFSNYIKGHLPTISKFGGRVVFRSTTNVQILGTGNWDAIAIQEWPSEAAFNSWLNSEEYQPWAKIRDKAATISIVRCSNQVVS